MTWQGRLLTTPIVVAAVTAVWFVRGAPSVFWVPALAIAGTAGLLLGVCALAGARIAVVLARALAPRRWQWRQMFALCIACSTLVFSVPVAAWLGAGLVLAPYLVAGSAYLCALVICPPLDRAMADLARSAAS
ncbi:hypothetical protein ACFYVR_26220 [Rhodococcus sp. NPDC003318]|uniref:hypothetical protein n=1 Tax=Rhodococcus sp. NPDC003318 TaxID=3364503 RepID=UPI0036A28C6E